ASQVYAGGAHRDGQRDVVVDDQRHGVRVAQLLERSGFGMAPRGIGGLVAVLQHPRAAGQRLRDSRRQVGARAVGDRIQAAVRELDGCHGVGFFVASWSAGGRRVLSQRQASCENALFALEQRSTTMSQSSTETATLRKWMCVVCGYIYDEALGVPEEDIAPGTRWEDVPETWTCPDGGATKSDFEMIEVDLSPMPACARPVFVMFPPANGPADPL